MKKKIHIIGLSPVNDAYPNIKYKIIHLETSSEFTTTSEVIPLNPRKSLYKSTTSINALFVLKYALLHTLSLYKMAKKPRWDRYITYPSITVANLAILIPKRVRGKLYLDAFISLYDTIVFDRKLFNRKQLIAKCLYIIERRAYAAAERVLVDTPENAKYLSKLFNLPVEKFKAIPLAIPPTLNLDQIYTPPKKFRCVFVGSFVPLQGIKYIVEATKILKDQADIEFVFIGEGQDENYLATHIKKEKPHNITWHKGHYSNQFIIKEILNASIGLGIFGDTDKADRVIPYKIYHYLQSGIPVLTSKTTAITTLIQNTPSKKSPFFLCKPNDPKSLADSIASIYRNYPSQLPTSNDVSSFFNNTLSYEHATKALASQLLTSTSQQQ